MMMVKVIALTVGPHQLILLDFYPFLKRYIQPHQHDITNLLAVAAQSCHDKVPPRAVEPLFKQIVNQFVHDRSRPEAIAVGLSAVREICMRMLLLMSGDLLQDLALYKKSSDKAVSAAARSLIALFREISPSLLIKKDRGRPVDPKARPMAYGETIVSTDVPGAELMRIIDNDDGWESGMSNDTVYDSSDNDQENCPMTKCINEDDDEAKDGFLLEDEYDICYSNETSGSNAEDYVEDIECDLEDSEEFDEEVDEVSEHKENGDPHSLSDDVGVEKKNAMEETLKEEVC